tara:strand:- start:42 stop:608 length:567 start_codon:yes stop_codon:yes gene_type:complete
MEKKNNKKKTLVGRNILTLLFIISVIALVLIFSLNKVNINGAINIYIRNPLIFYILIFPLIQIYAPVLHINQSTIIFILLVGLSFSVMFPNIFDFIVGLLQLGYNTIENIIEIRKPPPIEEVDINGEIVQAIDDEFGGYDDLATHRVLADTHNVIPKSHLNVLNDFSQEQYDEEFHKIEKEIRDIWMG